MIVFGGEIRITAVNSFPGLKSLKEEIKKLNDKYKFMEDSYLDEFCRFQTKNNDSFFFNTALGFEIIKDNYDEFFYASDFFEEVVVSDKEAKIKRAEITDERILIKIKTEKLTDFKSALFTIVAFGNITNGIIDLIAFADETFVFDRQYYTNYDWEKEIVQAFHMNKTSDF